MYESYFGFTQRPFQLNPDPSFYFDSTQHRRAMAFVEYGLHQSEGFVVVTGEVGAGKTTLVRSLLSRLDSRRIVAANIVSTQLEADDMLRMVAAAFGIKTRNAEKADLLLGLEATLASHARDGKRSLLIVDEAQNLTPRAVEELRMLSNFQLGSHALLQSFLIGQPEFRHILQSPDLHQLRQRVIAACHIGPLDLAETRRYIEHRLTRAGWKGVPELQSDVFVAVHAATLGVPRRINLILDRLLLSAFLSQKRLLTAQDVGGISAEINGETSLGAGEISRAEPARPLGHDEPLLAPAPRPLRPGPLVEELAAPIPPAPSPAEAAKLEAMEREVRELREQLARVEQGNQATLGLLRRFLGLARSQQGKGE